MRQLLLQMSKARLHQAAAVGLFFLWCVLVGIGLAWQFHYDSRSGSRGRVPDRWLSDQGLPPLAGRPRILMFVHPYCGCTHATMEQVARVLPQLAGRADLVVAVYRDPAEPEAWAHTWTWDAVGLLPRTRRVIDTGGRLAKAFGVYTSGHAIVFDDRGIRRFSGGITASRGMAGDNAALDALVAWVTKGHATLAETPVFGCYLTEVDASEEPL